MRVCFVSHTAGRGGAESALVELLQGLIAEGVDCKVLVPKKGPLLETLNRLDVEWKIIRYSRWVTSVGQRLMLGRRILRLIKTVVLAIPMAGAIHKWECDVVYSNTATIGAGAFAARLARRPHIWHLHEFGFHDHNFLFDLGERRAVQLIDRLSAIVIANSHAVAKYYASYIEWGRLRVIYQAVTPQWKKPDLISNNKFFQCIIVGTLNAHKGQHEAISAVFEVAARGVNVYLLLVGKGKKCFTATLLQQVKGYGLEQRVKFYGYAENPMPLIAEADLVLMCSRREAFGRVTVEAMLAGKAIIGSDSGGTAELIKDGKTGLLYRVDDHIDLADKIQYLYENPIERARLGTAAGLWAAGRFTQKRYAREVISLLDDILMKRKVSSTKSDLI